MKTLLLVGTLVSLALPLSSSLAWADAADRDFPDNPILAEQYYYSHKAALAAAAAARTPARSTGLVHKPYRHSCSCRPR
ncbi:hypothetical protein [Labrys monachus]|uniref:Uncharacterized protein n=1 Tax=Labrys monachus TaxID=217067 RepID=A0ABU0FDM4_9HYPH|nr:hypothetical protein [Labrys monachus]MDQ0392713.1 hypothetical protein [Labrys monachus]